MKYLIALGFVCFVGTAFAGQTAVETEATVQASCCAPAVVAAPSCAGVDVYRRAPLATWRENRRIRRANRVTVLRRSCAGLRVHRGCGG